MSRFLKQGKDISLLDAVIETLRLGKPLDAKRKDHQLAGNYRLFRECHIKPDWLLIYMIEDDVLTLTNWFERDKIYAYLY
ncbi:MAG: type II toxin-antitoxin system YafQ family toxin [Erysipelotrichaceae bacterium]|nr:type II toxin-antitoxin system YafQ family toxin [Erysipelotrichaceae bacterium]